MPTTTMQLTKALKVITREQLLAFLFAVEEHHVFALKLMKDDLAEGQTLEDIFDCAKPASEEPLLSAESKVKRVKPITFEITVGYSGGDVGDGGTFEVEYSKNEVLETTAPGVFWRC